MQQLRIEKIGSPRPLPDPKKLGFGKYFTDHMYLLDYSSKQGWHSPRIVPYGPMLFEPGASVLHYGQAMFEGLKAYHGRNGKIRMFRPNMNLNRIAAGAERICLPKIPVDLVSEGLKELIRLDERWIPNEPGASLYIRPTLIGTESFLGVRPADEALFFIILSPVGAYYAEGLDPVRIWVETDTIRAATGGLGGIKAGANYASSLLAAKKAKEKGYAQVLWLDAVEHRWIEEVGTMNVFFKIGDTVITPPLGGTILNGVTRDSIIHILKDWKVPLQERPISLDEIREAHKKGTLLEAFGTGTAAVISPIGEFGLAGGETLKLENARQSPLGHKLYDELTAIQYGDKEAPKGWIVTL